MKLHPADRLAFDKAMVANPVWNRFDTTGDALNLPQNVLLHAGPAFAKPDQITLPILNSACVAAVYERLAKDFRPGRSYDPGWGNPAETGAGS